MKKLTQIQNTQFKQLAVLVLVFLILFIYCKEEPVKPKPEIEPIEPEMILIDEDLTFTYLENSYSTINIDTQMSITLEPYYIGKFELSNLEYYQFVRDGGYENNKWWSEKGWNYKNKENWTKPKYWGKSNPPYFDDTRSNKPNMPVWGISFYEAEAYCNWLTGKTGEKYRVPISSEWVRAAKGPDPGRKYPWGNEWIEGRARYIFWYDSVFAPIDSFINGKSYDGCYNMIGNVYEITISIVPLYGIERNIKIFSYPDFNDTPSSMTTYSCTGFIDYGRICGLRLCKEN